MIHVKCVNATNVVDSLLLCIFRFLFLFNCNLYAVFQFVFWFLRRVRDVSRNRSRETRKISLRSASFALKKFNNNFEQSCFSINPESTIECSRANRFPNFRTLFTSAIESRDYIPSVDLSTFALEVRHLGTPLSHRSLAHAEQSL